MTLRTSEHTASAQERLRAEQALLNVPTALRHLTVARRLIAGSRDPRTVSAYVHIGQAQDALRSDAPHQRWLDRLADADTQIERTRATDEYLATVDAGRSA